MAVTASLGVLAGCGSGGPKGPTAGATTTSVATATTTSLPAPPATEPLIETAKLYPILLHPADLPSGFTRAPTTDTGADLTSIQPCGQPLLSVGTTTAQVIQVLARARDHLRLVEQVRGFGGSPSAAGPVTAVRALGAVCHQYGATSVTVIQPLAVGEDVAGLHLSAPTGVVDVAMIRSGPIVATIFLAAGRPIPLATFQAVVRAAGTKLAVGTGG